MLRSLLTSCSLLALALLLATCCANVGCNCQDQNDDAIFLRFDKAVYSAAQLKTIFVLRMPLDTAQRPRVDTARFEATTARPYLNDSLIIRTDKPFAAAANRKLGAYRYHIFTPDKKTVNYTIDSVQIRGRLAGDGCCTCYDNTQKIMFLDHKPYDLTDPSEKDTPQYFVLPY